MTPEESFVRGLFRRVITIRHHGPGPHPGTGTDQSVHGGGNGAEVAEEAKAGPIYPPAFLRALPDALREDCGGPVGLETIVGSLQSYWLTPAGDLLVSNGEHNESAIEAGFAVLDDDSTRLSAADRKDLRHESMFDAVMASGVHRLNIDGRTGASYVAYQANNHVTRAQREACEGIALVLELPLSDWRIDTGSAIHSERQAAELIGLVERGGPGSGHFGHEGRPGEVGGSLPSGEVAEEAREDTRIPEDIRNTPLYHATDSEEAARSIMESGRIVPGAGGRTMMSPVSGRVYATQDLEYALIYALGGATAGTEAMPDSIKESRYGYIFEIDPESLDEVQPDEDSVGRMLSEGTYPWLNRLAESFLSPYARRRIAEGLYANWASGGKTLLRHMTPEQGWELIRGGANVANAGDIEPSRVWRVDKTDSPRFPHRNYSVPDTDETRQERVRGILDIIEPVDLVARGGPGSGHFGHEGRPGEVGGSEPGDQAAVIPEDIAQPVTVIPEDIASGKVTISPEDALLGQPIQRIENTVYGTGYTTEDYLQLAQHVVDEQPEAFRQFMAQVEQALEDGTSTMEAYYDPETDEWTPERRLLHDQIVNDILQPGTPAPSGTEPEAVIMGGLPGSGKSSVLAERAASGQFDGYVHVDSDIIKGMLPEYEGWNAALLHDESSAIVEQIFQRCVERRLPVMYDATLRSASTGQGIVSTLEAVGYNTRLIYVDVPIEESMRRVLSRFASGTGRYVSPFYVATHDGRNLLNWEALKGQVDAWEHWDNGQPQGQSPTLVAQGNRRQT